jgi:ABC transporter DrrB family efflux protein
MTAVAEPRPAIRDRGWAAESLTITWRNLLHIRRMPEMLMDVTIQPVMFVLLFAFVFGGAITVPGVDYKEFLIPGVMAQTMAFSSFVVAMGLNNDLDKGIVDRFRSLPINRASVLVGRSVSSLIHSTIGIVVMGLTGLTVGWRIREGVVHAVWAYLLLLAFGFAMIWVGIWVGSLMRSVEAVQGFMFTVMFPLTFVANTFVPTEGMPDWLRFLAEWNPVSAVTASLRELWGNNGSLSLAEGSSWPLRHPEITSLGWSVLITAVIAPLAIAAFRQRAKD